MNMQHDHLPINSTVSQTVLMFRNDNKWSLSFKHCNLCWHFIQLGRKTGFISSDSATSEQIALKAQPLIDMAFIHVNELGVKDTLSSHFL